MRDREWITPKRRAAILVGVFAAVSLLLPATATADEDGNEWRGCGDGCITTMPDNKDW